MAAIWAIGAERGLNAPGGASFRFGFDSMRKLTDLQARFADEYRKDANATRAALRAGYSRWSAHVAHHLLWLPHVAEAIGEGAPHPPGSQSGQAAERALTRRERQFVDAYLVDFNATKAALSAGYSGSTAHSGVANVLHRPPVAAEIERLMAIRSRKAEVSAENVLRELARQGFFDARKLVGADGKLLPLNALDADTAAALVLEIDTDADGNSRIKIKSPAKQPVLADLARHLGMVDAKGQPVRRPAGRVVTDEDRMRAIEALLARAGKKVVDAGS